MLVETFRNMERRVQACLDANGEHFQHLLWLPHVSYRPRYVRVKFH
jgi:histidinol phosphatase-like enzyme